MWIVQSLKKGLAEKQEAEFHVKRRRAFSILIFTLLYNVFLGTLLFLGEDIMGALILLAPSGGMLTLLIMIQGGRVQQEDIENVASPYMEYTAEIKNSVEHLSEIIREEYEDNSG